MEQYIRSEKRKIATARRESMKNHGNGENMFFESPGTSPGSGTSHPGSNRDKQKTRKKTAGSLESRRRPLIVEALTDPDLDKEISSLTSQNEAARDRNDRASLNPRASSGLPDECTNTNNRVTNHDPRDT